MNLYEKIKEFTSIIPSPMDIGNYLKDSLTVNSIYFEMNGLEQEEDVSERLKLEKVLYEKMTEIMKRWGRI